MSNTTKRWAIWAILAAVAGYIGGILTAPQSGKETRSDLKKAADRSMAEAEKQLKRLHTQIAELIVEGKNKSAELGGVAKTELQAAVNKAVVAKEKARDILSAVHEGDAQDEDLRKAISDASSAMGNLKAYLKK